LPLDKNLVENNKQLSKFSSEELSELLKKVRESLKQSDFTVSELTDRLNKLLEQTNQKPGVLFSLVRIATTQVPASPGLADTLFVLGKETALRRIDQQINTLDN
jgi:nondiscriminating glutamyl-tRNA synthetase